MNVFSLSRGPGRLLACSAMLVTIGLAGAFAGQAVPSLVTPSAPPVISVNQGLPVPAWAFAERAMLAAAADGAQLWVDRYLNTDGSLNIVERWGVTDGPDDITESMRTLL